MRGLNRAAAEFNLHLVVLGCLANDSYTHIGAEIPLEQLGYDPAQLDGTVAFFAGQALIARMASLHQGGHPVALVFRTGPVPHVIAADEPAIAAVVCRLHRHGHRRIAFVRGPEGNHSADLRFCGYRQGLAQAGLPCDPALLFQGSFHEEITFQAVHAALSDGVRFTAILACSDVSAFGVMRALKVHGISVPGEVELVGYDNRYGAAISDPPLTTFEIPLEEMAHVALSSIARQLRGEAVPLQTVSTPVFIPRDSTRFTDMDPLLDKAGLSSPDDDPVTPAVQSLLEAVPADGSVEEVLAATEKIMAEAIRLDLPLPALTRMIEERVLASTVSDDIRSSRRRILSAALGLTRTATQLTYVHESEYAQTFSNTTIRLRGLPLDTLSEGTVAEVLREGLAALGFQEARLYLKSTTATGPAPDGTEGTLYRWDFRTASRQETPAAFHDVPAAALELSLSHRIVLFFPLIVGHAVVGNFVSDPRARYRVELAELIRHVTGAMHSLVLYRELARSNETLRQSQYFYASLVQSLPQIIVRKDAHGRFTYANECFARLVGMPLERIIGGRERDIFPPEFAHKIRTDDQHVLSTGQPVEYERMDETNGTRRHLQIKKTALLDDAGVPVGVQVIIWDITPFRETEARLRETQRELIEVSRLAGMAEIATGVLHNIGNALNSVNTSAGLVSHSVRQLKIDSVGRLDELLRRDSEPWGVLFSQDPRGRKVTDFVRTLDLHLKQGRDRILQEIRTLRDGVEHINQIVAAQQEFARASGLAELQTPSETLDYALRLCEAELLRHQIAIVRDYQPAPPIRLERHKVVQILVNLIRNAKDSLARAGRDEKRVTVGIRTAGSGEVRYFVADNGAGIAAEDLPRLFTMGFTTKKEGHGFGLHNSALTASSLGGSLQAESDGPGCGAVFFLNLPAAVAGTPADNPPAVAGG